MIQKQNKYYYIALFILVLYTDKLKKKKNVLFVIIKCTPTKRTRVNCPRVLTGDLLVAKNDFVKNGCLYFEFP